MSKGLLKTSLFIIFVFSVFVYFVFTDNTSAKSHKNSKLLADSIIALDKVKIDRFKPVIQLSPSEKDLYLKIIRRGGINLNLDDRKEVIRVRTGSQLMRVISYPHIVSVFKYLSRLDSYSSSSEGRNVKSGVNISPLFQDNNAGSGVQSRGVNESKSKRFSSPIIIKLILGKEGVRNRVRESFMGGVLNRDPRVRLFSINILRRLIPDATDSFWHFINRRIEKQRYARTNNPAVWLDSSYETIKGTDYKYLKIDSKEEISKITYNELLTLRSFISRFILVKKIESGNSSLIKTINIGTYNKLLGGPIDNESSFRFPMNYFSSKAAVNALINGLKNINEKVREDSANALVRILNIRGPSFAVSTRIFKALSNSQWSSRVIMGFSDKEISGFSKREIMELTCLYLTKVVIYKPCLPGAEDRYDDPKDPRGCVAYDREDNPVLKSEFMKGLEVREEKKEEELKKASHSVKKEYILE